MPRKRKKIYPLGTAMGARKRRKKTRKKKKDYGMHDNLKLATTGIIGIAALKAISD